MKSKFESHIESYATDEMKFLALLCWLVYVFSLLSLRQLTFVLFFYLLNASNSLVCYYLRKPDAETV